MQIIGPEAAKALVREYGGEDIRVPAHSTLDQMERLEKMEAMYHQGVHYAAAAARLGVTRSWAHRQYKRLGLATRARQRVDLAQVRALVARGYHYVQIAEQMQISESYACQLRLRILRGEL